MEKVKNEVSDLLNSLSDGYCLIVWDDDINTFEHVISCFISVLDMAPSIAVSHTVEVHNEGKSIVKKGNYEELYKYDDTLKRLGLNSSIDILE